MGGNGLHPHPGLRVSKASESWQKHRVKESSPRLIASRFPKELKLLWSIIVLLVSYSSDFTSRLMMNHWWSSQNQCNIQLLAQNWSSHQHQAYFEVIMIPFMSSPATSDRLTASTLKSDTMIIYRPQSSVGNFCLNSPLLTRKDPMINMCQELGSVAAWLLTASCVCPLATPDKKWSTCAKN